MGREDAHNPAHRRPRPRYSRGSPCRRSARGRGPRGDIGSSIRVMTSLPAHSAAGPNLESRRDEARVDQRRPVSERRPWRRPPARISGDPRRSGRDQRGDLAAESLDRLALADRGPRRAGRPRNGDSTAHHAGRHVPRAQAFDERIFQLEPRASAPDRARSAPPRVPWPRRLCRRPPPCRSRSSRRDTRPRPSACPTGGFPVAPRTRTRSGPSWTRFHRRQIDVHIGRPIARRVVDLIDQLLGHIPDRDEPARSSGFVIEHEPSASTFAIG